MTVLALDEGLSALTGDPWPGVRYFCTMRHGGHSAAPWDSLNLGTHVGDAPGSVMDNRAMLRAQLPAEPVWLEQVHGTTVFDADLGGVPAPAAPELKRTGAPARHTAPRHPGAAACADAAVTVRPGVVLAILTADCLPVVLGACDGGALGVVHAGWRGLAGGVLENALCALRDRHPGTSGWRAWIGPAISQAAFEVGPDVRAAFVEHTPGMAKFFGAGRDASHWQADLSGIARARLKSAGVAHVECSRACTFLERHRYFSYRRQHPTGRQATLAWLV